MLNFHTCNKRAERSKKGTARAAGAGQESCSGGRAAGTSRCHQQPGTGGPDPAAEHRAAARCWPPAAPHCALLLVPKALPPERTLLSYLSAHKVVQSFSARCFSQVRGRSRAGAAAARTARGSEPGGESHCLQPRGWQQQPAPSVKHSKAVTPHPGGKTLKSEGFWKTCASSRAIQKQHSARAGENRGEGREGRRIASKEVSGDRAVPQGKKKGLGTGDARLQ